MYVPNVLASATAPFSFQSPQPPRFPALGEARAPGLPPNRSLRHGEARISRPVGETLGLRKETSPCSTQQVGRPGDWTAGRPGRARPQHGGREGGPARCGLNAGRAPPARPTAPSANSEAPAPADLTVEATQCHEPQTGRRWRFHGLSAHSRRCTATSATTPSRRERAAHAPSARDARESRDRAACVLASLGIQEPRPARPAPRLQRLHLLLIQFPSSAGSSQTQSLFRSFHSQRSALPLPLPRERNCFSYWANLMFPNNSSGFTPLPKDGQKLRLKNPVAPPVCFSG